MSLIARVKALYGTLHGAGYCSGAQDDQNVLRIETVVQKEVALARRASDDETKRWREINGEFWFCSAADREKAKVDDVVVRGGVKLRVDRIDEDGISFRPLDWRPNL